MSPTQAEIEAALEAYLNRGETPQDAMAAALEVAEHVRWQPIETAPRDEWILLWVVAEKQQCAITGTISESEEGKIWNGTGYQPNLATHWQRLPSPPESK